jgi:hypothetical protein
MNPLKITISPVFDADAAVLGYHALLNQNDLTFEIATDPDPIACLRRAAEWCEAGPIDLRKAGRRGDRVCIART